MPKTEVLPDPNSLLTVGASMQVVRTGLGVVNVVINYNPGTDIPEEFNAGQLSPIAQTLLTLIHDEVIALYKIRRGYTP
jgi:hypothetical protein